MPNDRAIRHACQVVVLIWIATVLGWRELGPREIRVPVRTTSIEAMAVPPEAEPEPAAESTLPPDEPTLPPEPPAEIETAAEPEPAGEPEPLEPEPPALEPNEVAEIPEPIAEPPASEILEPEPAPAPVAQVPSETPLPAAPDPAPAARLESPPLPVQRVAEADVARGGTLLSGDDGFPVLESRYEGFGSFREYARAMQNLGSRFVVVNRRAIVGTIDPWTLEPGALGDASALSPRARDYAGETALLPASRAARRRHGNRAEIMMLVPRRIDAALFGGIARALEARGREPGAYRQILARYERGPGGQLRLRVESAVARDGRTEPLPLLFDLQSLTRS